jgi:hypothetical protein
LCGLRCLWAWSPEPDQFLHLVWHDDLRHRPVRRLRRHIQQIQTAVAGADVTIAVKALLDSISLLIAVGAKDQPTAFSMIDTLPPMMKHAVISEWDRAREMRARGIMHTPRPDSDRPN